MYHCYHCQTPWESSLRQPAVKESCSECGAYLHCCKNCRHHMKGRPNECYIPDTEKIADKRMANFCDEFEFRTAGSAQTARTTFDRDRSGLWGEEPANPVRDEENGDVKDWLLESDIPVRDFNDLFED